MNNNKNIKRFCGLFGEHIDVSHHNDNGRCRCMDCNGLNCKSCSEYGRKIAELLRSLDNTKCDLCRRYVQKAK